MHACRNKTLGDEIEQKEQTTIKWLQKAPAFPTYYRMVLTVQEDDLRLVQEHKVACFECEATFIKGNLYCSVASTIWNICEICEHNCESKSVAKMKLYVPPGILFHLQTFAAIVAS